MASTHKLAHKSSRGLISSTRGPQKQPRAKHDCICGGGSLDAQIPFRNGTVVRHYRRRHLRPD